MKVDRNECPNGYTFCPNCNFMVRCCCVPEHEFWNIRPPMEVLDLPCTFQISGCQQILPPQMRPDHEKVCKFRPYHCPYPTTECNVTGDIPFMVSHLQRDHKVGIHSGCTFNNHLVKSNPKEVSKAKWMLTIFKCFGHYFCLHVEAFQLGGAPVCMLFMRFMGSQEDAEKFSYSLEVNANGRKLLRQGVAMSIRDGHSKVLDSHDGLIIGRNMANFSGADKRELKLRVTGRIWREAA